MPTRTRATSRCSPDGRLAILDFGSVGRLDTRQRLALQDLLLALGRGDPAAFRDALLELVTRAEEIDELLLERALGQFMVRLLTGGTAATPEMFTDLFRLASRFELVYRPRSPPSRGPSAHWKARSPC